MKDLTIVDVAVVDQMSNPNLAMCFGKNCQDNEPYSDSKSFDELVELFREPDTKRGELSLDAYLELDKDDKAQKGKRSRE
jgi:hypothetical protein